MLFYNALRTPDGTVIESTSTHDFVAHRDANGLTYFVDGGHDYSRASAHGDEEYLYVDDRSPHADIREHFEWLSYGLDGNSPKVILLKDMEESHILAIIHDGYPAKHFINELIYRGLDYPELYV